MCPAFKYHPSDCSFALRLADLWKTYFKKDFYKSLWHKISRNFSPTPKNAAFPKTLRTLNTCSQAEWRCMTSRLNLNWWSASFMIIYQTGNVVSGSSFHFYNQCCSLNRSCSAVTHKSEVSWTSGHIYKSLRIIELWFVLHRNILELIYPQH